VQFEIGRARVKLEGFSHQENCKMSYKPTDRGSKIPDLRIIERGISQKAIADNIECHPQPFAEN